MTFFRATIVSVLLGSAAFAQNASAVRANSFEVGGFVGASHGLDRYQVMGGGNVTYAVNKYILPYGTILLSRKIGIRTWTPP